MQGMEGDTQQPGHGGQGAGGWYDASHPASPMPAQHHQVSAVTTRASNEGLRRLAKILQSRRRPLYKGLFLVESAH